MKATYELADENDDGILDCVLVLTKDYDIPLIGDYRGVRLAIIPFSSKEGRIKAEELARLYCGVLNQWRCRA